MYEDEVPKYRKKSNNGGMPRAKHKHIYAPCLLRVNNEKTHNWIFRARYCTICGRLSDLHGFEVNRETHMLMSSEEVLNKYSSYPIFDVTGYDVRFVVVDAN